MLSPKNKHQNSYDKQIIPRIYRVGKHLLIHKGFIFSQSEISTGFCAFGLNKDRLIMQDEIVEFQVV